MSNTQTPTNSNAAPVGFMRGKAEIDDLITRIQTASADHFGTEPEAVNWGHAGSLGFVTERLNELVAFLQV